MSHVNILTASWPSMKTSWKHNLLLALLLWLCTEAGAQSKPYSDPRYLMQARYHAGSLPHPKTPNSHITFANFPTTIQSNRLLNGRLGASISATKEGLRIIVANGSDKDIWLPATNGSLSAFLEAKVGDKWQPIEFRQRIDCGASNHKVLLPNREQWSFERPLPKGDFKTLVRFCLREGVRKIWSNELSLSIPRGCFRLSPDDAKRNTAFANQVGSVIVYPLRPTKDQLKIFWKFGYKPLH
jgi:hypothetical protein